MYLLSKNDYWRALLPLSKVKVNHLFALFVLEKKIEGRVFTDNPENPTAFYVVHPYGMSLLFGSTANGAFNETLKIYLLNSGHDREKPEWLQAYPGTWDKKIASLLGNSLIRTDQPDVPGAVALNTRANFRFNYKKYAGIRNNLGESPHPVVPVNRSIYELMKGTVVPENFWNSASDFVKYGAGFSMMINDKPVCTAYSAYIFEGLLELGIETVPEYRGKGYAMHTCAALIDYCTEHDYEPVWSCRLENTGSYNLARKLGFELALTLPYYRLPI